MIFFKIGYLWEIELNENYLAEHVYQSNHMQASNTCRTGTMIDLVSCLWKEKKKILSDVARNITTNMTINMYYDGNGIWLSGVLDTDIKPFRPVLNFGRSGNFYYCNENHVCIEVFYIFYNKECIYKMSSFLLCVLAVNKIESQSYVKIEITNIHSDFFVKHFLWIRTQFYIIWGSTHTSYRIYWYY